SSDDTQPRISTVTAAPGIGNATIVGATNDGTGTGAKGVQVRIWVSTGIAKYWDGSGDLASAYSITDPNAAWFLAGSSNGWVNWYTTFTFLNDYKYHIEARAQDQTNTYSTAFATASFVMDQVVPQSAVTVPANGTTVRPLAQISGTMADMAARYPGNV